MKKCLVLGATGSIGYAFTRETLQQGIDTTILARNPEKVQRLFGTNSQLHIRQGDVNDPLALQSASKEMEAIFFGINYPYQHWDQYMIPLTRSLIDAASENQSTILFPGNIYPYGFQAEPIREDTICEPTTRKGKIRFDMEKMLQDAASSGRCRVINLRLPDFWGPNVTNGLIKPLFGNAANNKSMQWLIRSDVKHQFVYTPDAGRLFFRLSRDSSLPPYFVLNYGGQVMESLSWFANRISTIAGSTPKLKVLSKSLLKVLAIFMPPVKELIENFYQFEHAVLLDDSKLRSMYPDLKETPLEDAIKETIEWYRSSD